ncbi:MAG: hypothetical protein PWP47_1720 [Synergistaceae bacterium]|nr:hypothetical protein [Synergistaceae bacterium]
MNFLSRRYTIHQYGTSLDHNGPQEDFTMDRLILSLLIINFAIYSYSNAFFFLAPYLAARGYTAASAGILVGVFYAATTAVRPVGSLITERIGVRKSMIWSSGVCIGCALALQAYQGAFAWFVGVRVVMGLAYSIFMVALTTYQALVIEESKRGLGFALVSVGSLIPMFTVVPLTDYLVRSGQDRFFMILPLAAAALSFSLALRLQPAGYQGSTGQNQPMEWGTYGDLFRETPAGKIVFSCFFFGLCDASIVFIGTVLLEKGLVPSWFIFSLGVGALFVRTAGRNLFNRYQRTVFAGPSFLLMALCLLGLAFARTSFGLVLWGFFYGMGMGYGYPAHLALTADLAAPRLRAKASALVHFSMDLSWFILPLYMGFGCTFFGAQRAFLLFTLVCIAGAVMTTVMWLPRRKGRAH